MAEVLMDDAPRKARDLFEKGFAAMERGNLDYAIDMLTASLEIEPRLLRARMFLRAAEVRRFKEAKKGPIAHFMSSISGLPAVLSTQALIKTKPAQALKAAERLMRIDPLNLSFITLLGKAAVAADMREVAIQSLEIAKDHYPKNIPVMKWLAELYLANSQTHDARLLYEEIIHLRPNDPKIIKALKDATALDTMKKGGWNEAESYRDVMKDTKEAVLLEQEAKAVKSGRDLDDLIEETKVKLQREPDNINYMRSLADFYTRASRFDDALTLLKEAQEGAGRGDSQIDRSISTIQSHKYDHEIAQCEAAGDQAGAEKKRQEKADFLWQDAADRVKRYPNDLQFRYELGVLSFERNRLNEAIQEFQLSQRNPQRRTRSLYYLAMCFKLKHQYDIAMEQLEKAASELNIMDETKKDILYEMGQVAELMSQHDKAVQHYKEIYAVDILYKDVAQKIEKAYKK